MDNKKSQQQYYLDLVERWFDAETSEAEEHELKLFLASTDDPAFDEARAAFGYLSAASVAEGCHCQTAAADAPALAKRSFRRMIPALAVAASMAAAFFLGRMSATDMNLVVEDAAAGKCVSYVHGVEVADEGFAVATMENTLQDLFSAVPDPGADLSLIFNSNE